MSATSTLPMASQRSAGPSTSANQPASWLDFEPAAVLEHFDRRPFTIRHRLAADPRFELENLLELGRKLPQELIEYNAGNLPINQDPAKTPRNGLSPEETIRRIAECRSWLVLKHVEEDPHYRELLESCLTEIRPWTEQRAPGMAKPHAYIFITSPGSVTPYHMDPEHNFLLQVRGSKFVRLFDGRDPRLVSDLELEKFYGGRVRNMTLPDEMKDSGWSYTLEPGDGLHFPVTFPHWVQNGTEISVSFSITFRTPDLDRRRILYSWNHAVRNRGGSPISPGRYPALDSSKVLFTRLQDRLMRMLSRGD